LWLPREPSAAANFHQRSPVVGASEISEAGRKLQQMAGDIEEYIEKLKEAAEENRELFIGSIRMLAGRDPTKGCVRARPFRARGESIRRLSDANEVRG